MRILFDQAVHELRNKGNIAMLQVAVDRLHRMWPEASLEVVTLTPHLLTLYCPRALPVSPDGQYDWTRGISLRDRLLQTLPRPMRRLSFEMREEVWLRRRARRPSWSEEHVKSLASAEVGERGPRLYAEDRKEKAVEDEQINKNLIEGIDLYVAVGSQYMADSSKQWALQLLSRSETSIELGIPTVMVGQGIGPIEDPELRARAKSILPSVDLIAVREKLAAPRLLNSFGVDPSHVIVTGDDAVELVYRARRATLGSEIGIGLRIAYYTEIEQKHVKIIREALQNVAARYSAHLIAVPISHDAKEADKEMIRELFTGYTKTWNGWRRFDAPLELIKRVGRCRVVVTAAFHLAVFALSQGIPAICLAKSSFSMNRFLGLADQFGTGCEVIHLEDELLRERLEKAIHMAWNSALEVRPGLLQSAVRQIESGQNAYRQIHGLVRARSKR